MDKKFPNLYLLIRPPRRALSLGRGRILILEFIQTRYTLYKYKKKSLAYSSQGSHTGQLDFCNWLADSSTMG